MYSVFPFCFISKFLFPTYTEKTFYGDSKEHGLGTTTSPMINIWRNVFSVSCSVCMDAYLPCVCLIPVEDRRGHQMALNLKNRQLGHVGASNQTQALWKTIQCS